MTGKEPNCRDESDEIGCQLIVFKNNYNKNIPPIESAKDGSPIPADVGISITLMEVVEIAEVDHSIHLQFEISMEWKENRVTYKNLKSKSSLNALTSEDISRLWLPLVIYDNTDYSCESESFEVAKDFYFRLFTIFVLGQKIPEDAPGSLVFTVYYTVYRLV